MTSNVGYDFREAGAHWHETMIKDKSFHRGSHYHLLDDLKTVFMDGDHIHEVTEESVGTPGYLMGGEHTHKVIFANGTMGYTKPAAALKVDIQPGESTNGQHKHEFTPDSEVSRGGQHVHVVELPDGTTHKTLGFDEIKILIAKGEKLPQSLFDGIL